MTLNNKNILITLLQGGLGGAERQALGLAKYLFEEKKCTVDLLLLHSDFQTTEFTEFANHCHIRKILYFGEMQLYLPKEFSIKNLKRLKWTTQYLLNLRKSLINNKYDLIIPYLNHASKVSYFLYKLLPTVKFTFWHQLGLDIIKKDIIEKIVSRNIPCVIGNAPNCFEIFENDLPVSKDKLHLLPQYLTLNVKLEDKTLKRNDLKIPTDAIIIGMIAHYRLDKYQELLFNAFLKVLKLTDKKIHLVFLGNKNNNTVSLEIYSKLIKRVKELNLEQSVSILSNLDVSDVLNTLDIAVLVSKIEGMPNSLMEYMAYGLPAIAINHPGCKQLLEESEYLIKNDVDILTLKILKLIEDEKERELEGKLNKERIKKFNLPSYVKELERIINLYV